MSWCVLEVHLNALFPLQWSHSEVQSLCTSPTTTSKHPEPYPTEPSRRRRGGSLLQTEISLCEGDSTCAYTLSVPGAQSTTESKLGRSVREAGSARLPTV